MYLFILLVFYLSMIILKLLTALEFSQLWAGYFMAQPAVPVNEDRTDLLGVPPVWAKHSVNPPFCEKIG